MKIESSAELATIIFNAKEGLRMLRDEAESNTLVNHYTRQFT